MNAVQTAPRRQLHPPSPTERTMRRVGLVDRLALRLGLALIMWGRRPRPAATERYITPAELAELHNGRFSNYHLFTLVR